MLWHVAGRVVLLWLLVCILLFLSGAGCADRVTLNRGFVVVVAVAGVLVDDSVW